MRIAITGASGLIGSALVPALAAEGHEVLRLVRRAPDLPDEIRWNPSGGTVDVTALTAGGPIDAVFHLAGAGVSDHRWSDSYKRTILDSRVEGTTTIATAIARLDRPPSVLVSASAIGWYGDTGDDAVDETAPRGNGFLAEVVQAWEAAADPARDAGIRVVHPRTGLVWSGRGGAFAKQLPLFKFGLGGTIGSGRQYWSYISLVDEVAALMFLLRDPSLHGPVNLTAPNPVTNADATRAIAAAVHRPAFVPAPSFALRIVLGEFASDVTASQRVLPRELERAGFIWAHPTADLAAAAALVD